VQVRGRRDQCGGLWSAVACRKWDAAHQLVWEHCAGWQSGYDECVVRDPVWSMRRGYSAGPSGSLAQC